MSLGSDFLNNHCTTSDAPVGDVCILEIFGPLCSLICVPRVLVLLNKIIPWILWIMILSPLAASFGWNLQRFPKN